MVYTSSIPSFLHQPNWNLQQQQQQKQVQDVGDGRVCGGDLVESNRPQVLPLQQPILPLTEGGIATSRTNSMADRARQAKILPQTEQTLKCPRCESTNTKFCYFNNYSLSQPRHFCKTCRRYWTRGGSLRNVPVGGGCRKNKRSSRSEKGVTCTSLVGSAVSVNRDSGAIATPLHLPFLNSVPDHYGFSPVITGLGFDFRAPVDNQIDADCSTVLGRVKQLQAFPNLFAGVIDDQQQRQQTSEVMYRFDGEDCCVNVSALASEVDHEKTQAFGLFTQSSTSSKLEENSQKLINLQDQYLGTTGNDDGIRDIGVGNVIGCNISTSTSGDRTEYWTDLTTPLSASSTGDFV